MPRPAKRDAECCTAEHSHHEHDEYAAVGGEEPRDVIGGGQCALSRLPQADGDSYNPKNLDAQEQYQNYLDRVRVRNLSIPNRIL